MLSKLDRKILNSLNKNGRKSFRQVAKEVGTSSTAIYNNVKKLESSGVIKGYIPVIDPRQLGYKIIALVNLCVQHDIETNLMQTISKYEEVRAVYSITGEWDQVLICYFKELEDLDQFLFKKLKFPEIRRIVSQIVLQVVKDDHITPVSIENEET